MVLPPLTASLPWGSGPGISCNTLPPCLGQWAVVLLRHTAPRPGGSGQWTSCNALPHCLGAVGSGTFGRLRASSHSCDWAEQAQRWGAISGCAPQRRHVVSSTVSRWEDRWARTVIVGMLSMRCAVMWRCWSLSN